MEGEGTGFFSKGDKEGLIQFEKRIRDLLEEIEESWWLKKKALWISCGDENTKFFQDFTRGRKLKNMIWELHNNDEETMSTFEGLSNLGVGHFKNIFKSQGESLI